MAFNDAYDDYEQSEHVRQWLRSNGVAVIAGIVLGLLIIFGLHQWRSHQASQHAEAANHYAQMQQALAVNDQATASSAASVLQDQYKDTSFAVFAALQNARNQVAANKLADALTSLAWAEQHAGSDALKSLIGVRTARVELAQGHADQALARLAKLPDGDYRGMALELRGDAMVALKRNDDARKAYTNALNAYADDAPQKGLVQVKLDNLAVAGKQEK